LKRYSTADKSKIKDFPKIAFAVTLNDKLPISGDQSMKHTESREEEVVREGENNL